MGRATKSCSWEPAKLRLYVREIGTGVPIIVVHGGPDFDHEYLLPDLDRLARSFRLVYYDQRGRGRSFADGGPTRVSIASEVEDLDRVREALGSRSAVLLGHSWGGLLAMEYAIRCPARVSHLVLLNTAPVSHAGARALRRELERRRSLEESEQLSALVATRRYRRGDIDADLEYYRIYFGSAVREHGDLERLLQRLRAAFTVEGLLAARAIEQRLYEQTFNAEDYDLTPQLNLLDVPTLVIRGDDDFIPFEVARRIAGAIPESRFVALAGCGHFSYLEQPERLCESIETFLARG